MVQVSGNKAGCRQKIREKLEEPRAAQIDRPLLFKKATTPSLPLISTHYVLPRASRAVWRHADATATGYDFSRALRGARKIVATSIETTLYGHKRAIFFCARFARAGGSPSISATTGLIGTDLHL